MIEIVGSYPSPYVRKVLAALHLKGLAYEIDPIIPFFGNEAFTAISPLRRVPVLIDDGTVVADSTAILEYLEDRYPEVPIYPVAPGDRAKARWIEEYADSRIGDVIIWKLFNERVINPGIWRKPADEVIIAAAIETELPEIMDYLESVAPAHGFMFGTPGVADITVAAFFTNASAAGWSPDWARWPRAAAWIAATLALEAFECVAPFVALSLQTPPHRQRDVLKAAGAQISARTLGTDTPIKGPMSV